MSQQEIRTRVRNAFAAVPHARGLNNHMGSRATQEPQLLGSLFAELKQSGLFFVDSKTSLATRAFELARQQGVAAVLNDTFLDSVDEVDHVRQKLMYLADLAAARGSAIGIGHQYRNTLQALNEVLPVLRQRGFEFSTVEQLIGQPAKASSQLTQQPVTRRN